MTYDQFFDRPAILKRFDAATLKQLRKFGANVRLRAKRSIRDVGKRALAQARKIELRGRRQEYAFKVAAFEQQSGTRVKRRGRARISVPGGLRNASPGSLRQLGTVFRQEGRLRARDKLSALPGKPPKSHLGTLKKHIYFKAEARSVTTGPAFRRTRNKQRRQSRVAPGLLETGGRVTGKYLQSGERFSLTYFKHPFMQPAFDKQLSRLSRDWKNMLHQI
jgi:hypothetical protein